nr:GNAT family N-acetyltransferase [uncultured Massilia sp.]
MTTRLASADELGAVLALYGEGGYRGGVQAQDKVIVATIDGAVVGAVRLCLEHGVMVLRGMQVGAAFQGRGVGRALLAACETALGARPAYCLPYRHLAGFYGHAAFRAVMADALPDFLRARLAAYLTGGQEVLAMCRAGRPPAPD